MTPLTHAVMFSNHRLVHVLLLAGANPSLAVEEDYQPIAIARDAKDKESYALLLAPLVRGQKLVDERVCVEGYWQQKPNLNGKAGNVINHKELTLCTVEFDFGGGYTREHKVPPAVLYPIDDDGNDMPLMDALAERKKFGGAAVQRDGIVEGDGDDGSGEGEVEERDQARRRRRRI